MLAAAGAGRMRHLQLHGTPRRRAVRSTRPDSLRLANPIATRPRPDAPHPGRHPGPGGAAQRRPRLAATSACSRSGPAFADPTPEASAGRRRPAHRRHAAQLDRAGPAGRCHGRQGRRCRGCSRRSACRWKRSPSPRTRRASTTPAAPAWCARGRRPCWPPSASCIPRVLAALDLDRSRGRVRGVPGRHPRAQAPPPRRPRPARLPAGAARLRLRGGCHRAGRGGAPRGARGRTHADRRRDPVRPSTRATRCRRARSRSPSR